MFLQPWHTHAARRLINRFIPRLHPDPRFLPKGKCLFSNRMWFSKFSLVSVLTLITVLLSQSAVLARATDLSLNRTETSEIIYIMIGLLSASILIVESRRWVTFLLGGLLMGIIGVAIALLGDHFERLPTLAHLWIPTLVGMGLGFMLIGPWWWGYRQGYVQALYMTLSSQQQADPVFERLIQESTPQNETKPAMGFFKLLSYRARAIRYHRMVSRGEMKTLYTLIKIQIQQDWQEAQAAEQAELNAEKRQQIEALLAKADHLCEQSRSTSTLSRFPHPTPTHL